MGLRIGLVVLSLAVFGCGPEQTAREAEKQESDAITSEQKAQLETFEGRYRGYVTVDSKTKYVANLILRSFSSFVPVPGRLEIIEIPNMVGFMKVGEDNALNRSFNFGVFNSSQNTLRLTGPGSGTGLTTFSLLELRHDGTKLVGEYFSGPVESQVEFEKVGP